MDSRKRIYLFLPFLIAFAFFAGGISYADVDVPDVKKPVPTRKPVSKPYGEVSGSLSDVLKRIEALESRSGGGNVSAPKIRGIKIGGHMRHRFEMQHHFGLTAAGTAGAGGAAHLNSGANDYVEDFTLQRTKIFFDLDVNKNVRGFIQLQDVRTWGHEEAAAGSGTVGNLGRVDLDEGYVELRNLGDLSSALENVSVRIGRWQMFYGDHRLIGHLNWANYGRHYDGARVRWAKNGNWIDLFGFQIDEVDTGSDAAAGESSGVTGTAGEQDHILWGFYSHFKVTDGVIAEPYMINRFASRDYSGNESGSNARNGEERFTLGLRVAGKKIPGLPGVDFKAEQMFQFGDTEPQSAGGTVLANDDRDINAFAGAWGVGYTFSNVAWSPRIGYQFAIAEGDDNPADDDNDTFDHLYPTGHARLGYMDFHAFQNIQAHKIEFSAKPTKKLLLKADMWWFEADEEEDDWYGVVGGVAAAGSAAQATNPDTGALITDDEYGQELDLVFKYKLFKNFGVAGGWSHYWTDDYIEKIRGDDDTNADWFWLQTTMKF